ncbi:MAG TPA: hypothetical protein VJ784_16600 [Pyrinomonadaceae bacterium]|jgi:hypothetical protein|nr:hypothetical protein [Pyrinomonadaceae bacterium]
MRQNLISVHIFMLVCCFSTSQAWAQDCKPNVSREDKITKERIDIWTQSLFSTNFGSSLMSTSEISVFATVGRYGTFNAVNIEIQKREESATNAAFESAYRGAVGKQFYFGFKNGDPVAFVVTEVGNEAKVQQGLLSAKGVTTVVLSAVVQDNELATLREALTSRQIDSFRIVLSGDVRIEKSVNDNNGKKLMEKFSCFYQLLDKRGINLSAVAGSRTSPVDTSVIDTSVDYSKSAAGKYVNQKNRTEYIELKPDGTFYVQRKTSGYAGKYEITGNIITTVLPDGRAGRDKIQADAIIESDGTIWAREGGSPATSSAPSEVLTNEEVIRLTLAKLPDSVILTKIRNSTCKFDVSTDGLIKLKQAGVSDAVIQAMTEAKPK